MSLSADQIKQLKQLDLTLLKQLLADEKKLPRSWVS
jgi:hypothetical protein